MADSTSLVLYDPRTADPEVIALAGFLAGYAGRTREAYGVGPAAVLRVVSGAPAALV